MRIETPDMINKDAFILVNDTQYTFNFVENPTVGEAIRFFAGQYDDKSIEAFKAIYDNLPQLHNWELNRAYYYPDEVICTGTIYSDTKKRFHDGERIRTSFVRFIDFKRKYLVTENTVYKLV